MSNVGRCPHCHKSLIDEEISAHRCDGSAPITNVKDVWFEYSVKAKTDQGELIIVKGTDGTLYRFLPSPQAQRPQKSPDDSTEYLLEKKA